MNALHSVAYHKSKFKGKLGQDWSIESKGLSQLTEEDTDRCFSNPLMAKPHYEIVSDPEDLFPKGNIFGRETFIHSLTKHAWPIGLRVRCPDGRLATVVQIANNKGGHQWAYHLELQYDEESRNGKETTIAQIARLRKHPR